MLGGEGGGETEGGGATSIMAGIGQDDKASGGGGGGASGGIGAGEVFEGDRSSGNRWPRQETIALLKIRSDMDVIFRDSSLKGPLWEEVSRKMAELGYHRSAKKCKEKFENVYKYHKRTKEGRVGKSDGKNYRFFAELETLEQHQQLQHQHRLSLLPIPSRQQPVAADAVPVTMVMPPGSTVSSSPHSISVVHVNPHHHQQQQHQQQQIHFNVQPPVQPMPAVHSSPIQMENSPPSSPEATASPMLSPSSSSTSSDDEILGRGRKRKRKWKDFFEKLMKDVMDKQEELQKRLIDVVEKQEHDRLARDEAWKMQEMARLNRERELLVQERSMAAAKDAALISFLQKLSDQQHVPFPLPIQNQDNQTKTKTQINSQPCGASQLVPTKAIDQSISSQAQPPLPSPLPQPQPQARVKEGPMSVAQAPHSLNQLPPQHPPPTTQQTMVVSPMNNIISTNVEVQKTNRNGDSHNYNFLMGPSSSRWPKAEVEALINIRSNLDQKYQDNVPKGPLWEEISGAMKKLGYNRNAKRCKEKWENINKYFKKVKESNKRRPEDSKTCPYFHQLDALYREKKQTETTTTATVTTTTTTANNSSHNQVVMLTPMTVQPEQQWPVQHHDNNDSENTEDDDGEDDEEEEHGNGYEIVSNNAGGSMGPITSIATTTA